MFTVSFLHTDGSRQVSQYFETKRAAFKWAKWLAGRTFAAKVFVYHGPEGGDLLTTI